MSIAEKLIQIAENEQKVYNAGYSAGQSSGGCGSIDDSKVGADAWSSKNIVDKLCPSFTESGAVAVCEPVEGYPLEVTTEDGATQIIATGKNAVKYPYRYSGSRTQNGVTFTVNEDGTVTLNGTATAEIVYYIATDTKETTWDVKPDADYTLSVRSVSGTSSGTILVIANYYSTTDGAMRSWLSAQMNKTHTKACPTDIKSMGVYIDVLAGAVCNDLVVSIQVEAGKTATEHEPYREPQTFAVGEQIYGNAGVNTLFADVGNITVTGKKDPVAVINKLEATVNALLGG